jgi:excisionase family DNA binding protein
MFENYHDIIGVDDLCEILDVSRNTAYNLLRNGNIHSFRIGRVWKIPLKSVKKFIDYKSIPVKAKFFI